MASLAGAALAIGCSLQLDVDEPQCKSDDECSRRGFASAICQDEVCVVKPVSVDPVWGCVGQTRAAPTASYDVILPFIDVLDRAPVVGAAVTVCSDRDIECAQPQLGPVLTDETGTARFTLPASFSGYARVKRDTYLDVLVYFSQDQLEANNPLTLITSEVFDTVAKSQGLERTPGLGAIFIGSFTCENKRGVGVQFASDPAASTVFYYDGALPTTKTDRTDATGQSGILNLTPGLVTVTGVLADSLREVSRQRVLVRPDSITYVPARP